MSCDHVYSAGALLCQKIFMVAEQLVTHSFVFGDPLLGAGPRPRCRSVGTDTSHFGSRDPQGYISCGLS